MLLGLLRSVEILVPISTHKSLKSRITVLRGIGLAVCRIPTSTQKLGYPRILGMST